MEEVFALNNPVRKGKTLPLSPNLKTNEEITTTIIRLRFGRKGSTSYIAHLDMMRIFERSLKRAGIPCEYSQGFNPRPVMAFALPLGVGVETIDDYVDITVQGDITPAEFVNRLKSSLPDGIDVFGAIIAPKAKDSMMAQVCAAQYMFLANDFSRAATVLKESTSLMVTKTSKGISKIVDIKPLIITVEIVDINSLKILVKAGSKENLRPDLLLDALVDAGFYSDDDAKNTQIVRVGTFIYSADGKLVRPI